MKVRLRFSRPVWPAVVVAALLLAAACGGSDRAASIAPRVVDLSRAHGNLDGFRDAYGRQYVVNGNQAQTNLVVHNDRLVRGDPANVGPIGAPSLVIPNNQTVRQMSVSYVFTPGQTMHQSVVLGSCHLSLATSSIQFLVTPRRWLLFSTLKSTDADLHTDIVRLHTGTFDPPLAVDGKTTYTTTMDRTPGTRSVTVTFPQGNRRTFSDPQVGLYWGKRTVVQIMHPASTDGDAQITAITDKG